MFANKSKMPLYQGTPTHMNKYTAHHADRNNKLPKSIIRQMVNLAASGCCVDINQIQNAWLFFTGGMLSKECVFYIGLC